MGSPVALPLDADALGAIGLAATRSARVTVVMRVNLRLRRIVSRAGSDIGDVKYLKREQFGSNARALAEYGARAA